MEIINVFLNFPLKKKKSKGSEHNLHQLIKRMNHNNDFTEEFLIYILLIANILAF